jgi:MoaA/NifB/PqqE/SkfB family radical SAM enzyme
MPETLSLHPTMQCDYHCVNCYLKKDIDSLEEKSPEFFLKLVEEASKNGIKELMIPVNYVKPEATYEESLKKDRNLFYYNTLRKKAIECGMTFSMTCNYEFIEFYKKDLDFDGIRLLSVSMNDFVTSTKDKKNAAIETMKFLKEKGVEHVNCTVLLSKNMAEQLRDGLASEILEVADTIFIISSKPHTVPMNVIYAWLDILKNNVLTMIDKRVLLDSCLKNIIGITNGYCSRHDMIYVNPYGEVKMCSYDKLNLFTLENPEQIGHVIKTFYPQKQVFDCPLLTMGKTLRSK